MSIDLHPGIRNDATVPAEGGNGGSRLPDAVRIFPSLKTENCSDSVVWVRFITALNPV